MRLRCITCMHASMHICKYINIHMASVLPFFLFLQIFLPLQCLQICRAGSRKPLSGYINMHTATTPPSCFPAHIHIQGSRARHPQLLEYNAIIYIYIGSDSRTFVSLLNAPRAGYPPVFVLYMYTQRHIHTHTHKCIYLYIHTYTTLQCQVHTSRPYSGHCRMLQDLHIIQCHGHWHWNSTAKVQGSF
jgi:hypothetical protein